MLRKAKKTRRLGHSCVEDSLWLRAARSRLGPHLLGGWEVSLPFLLSLQYRWPGTAIRLPDTSQVDVGVEAEAPPTSAGWLFHVKDHG